MQRALIAFTLAGLLIIAGCGGGSSVTDPDVGGNLLDIIGSDGSPEVYIPDSGKDQTEPGDTDTDQPPDDVDVGDTPETEEDSGGACGDPGCPCEDNSDCKTALCLEDMYGRFCAEKCYDTCEEGFKCLLVTVSGEPQYYCLPAFVNLCKPCEDSSECQAQYGTGSDLCVDNGPDGSFCGGDCGGEVECPEGFFCKTVPVPDGDPAKQCVPVATECECTEKYIQLQAGTNCFVENQWGLCAGFRYCSEDGLTDCDAQEPSEELCDGVDNDCDGGVDNDIAGKACDLVNVWGSCPGVLTCVDGKETCVGDEPAQEVCDGLDNNCDSVTDEGFVDSNNDGIPDCLTDDADGDGVPDTIDNCPTIPNPGQQNWDLEHLGADKDGKGDVCDPDDDDDGVADTSDCQPFNNEVYPGGPEKCDGQDNNCNGLVDENFSNIDQDSMADCIDPDDDNDGILDELDNCPGKYNPAQVNTDYPGDTFGDLCDPDDDNDDILDEVDNCPLKKNPEQEDNDEDLMGDKCDPDDDNDQVLDDEDNCKLDANPEQADFDDDDKGDICDPDIDNDDEANATDCDDFNPAVNHFEAEVCNGVDDNCEDGIDEVDAQGCVEYYKDVDQDGFGAEELKCLCEPTGSYTAEVAGDCADNDAAVNPSRMEICNNGKDDNCNSSQNDENAQSCTFFFFDQDNDGYGIETDAKCLCNQEGKYRATSSPDCNDGDPLINPGQQEICANGKDDNCNGDQNDENAIGSVTFYKDQDTDHYGITTDFKKLCSAEGLYSGIYDGDCDDLNPNVNPGAPEVCDGGKNDENCNGQIDEEDAGGCNTYYYDGDSDGYGQSAESRCLCLPSGEFSALDKGDCNDNNTNIHPGAPEVCNNLDDDCTDEVDDGGIVELCGEFDSGHGIAKCELGQCVLVCNPNYYDINGVFNDGCECVDDSDDIAGGGDNCAGAVNKGELQDNAATAEIYGNIPDPADGGDYYRFLATDLAEAGDGGCDNFFFHAELEVNPNNSYRIVVLREDDTVDVCSNEVCAGQKTYSWYTDYQTIDGSTGKLRGECPCSNKQLSLPAPQSGSCPPEYDSNAADGCGYDDKPPEPIGTVHWGVPGANFCEDNSRYFVVGVVRAPGSQPTCASYKLVVSNGLKSTQ
jgi:hypothetical protein